MSVDKRYVGPPLPDDEVSESIELLYGPDESWHVMCSTHRQPMHAGRWAVVTEDSRGEYISAHCVPNDLCIPDGTWRLAADDETMVWVPEGADGAATERIVRGTALQRWQDGQAANEVFGPGGAW